MADKDLGIRRTAEQENAYAQQCEQAAVHERNRANAANATADEWDRQAAASRARALEMASDEEGQDEAASPSKSSKKAGKGSRK